MNAYDLIDPEIEFNAGAANRAYPRNNPLAPMWLDRGVPSYTPPRARVGYVEDYLTRARIAYRENALNIGGMLWDAGFEYDGKTEPDPSYDAKAAYNGLPANIQSILSLSGFTVDAAVKATANVEDFKNWTGDALLYIEDQQTLADMDASMGALRKGVTKTASAISNYVLPDVSNWAIAAITAIPAVGEAVGPALAASKTASAGAAFLSTMGVMEVQAITNFHKNVQWQDSMGLLNADDIHYGDYARVAYDTATSWEALAMAAIAPAFIMARGGKPGKMVPNAVRAKLGLSDDVTNPLTSAAVSDYNKSRYLFMESVRSRFPHPDSPSPALLRHFMDRDFLGMSELEHQTFLDHYAKWIAEEQPTFSEIIKKADVGGKFSRQADILLEEADRLEKAAGTEEMLTNPVARLRNILHTRFGDKGRLFRPLEDPEVFRRIGFDTLDDVIEHVKLASAKELKNLLQYKRAHWDFSRYIEGLANRSTAIRDLFEQGKAEAEQAHLSWTQANERFADKLREWMTSQTETRLADLERVSEALKNKAPRKKGYRPSGKLDIDALDKHIAALKKTKEDLVGLPEGPLSPGDVLKTKSMKVFIDETGRVRFRRSQALSTGRKLPKSLKQLPENTGPTAPVLDEAALESTIGDLASPAWKSIDPVTGKPVYQGTSGGRWGEVPLPKGIPDKLNQLARESIPAAEAVVERLKASKSKWSSLADVTNSSNIRTIAKRKITELDNALMRSESELISLHDELDRIVDAQKKLDILSTGTKPNKRLGRQVATLTRDIEGLKQRLAVKPSAELEARLSYLQKRLDAVNLRFTRSRDSLMKEAARLRSKAGKISDTPSKTKFRSDVERYSALKKEAASKAKDYENAKLPDERKTAFRALNVLNKEIEKLGKKLKNKHGFDAETSAFSKITIRPRAAKPVVDVRSPETDSAKIMIADWIKGNVSAKVQQGLSAFNHFGNLPGIRTVNYLMKRAMLSRTGQEQTVFNGVSEVVRRLMQLVDDTHLTEQATSRITRGVRSFYLVVRGTTRKFDKKVGAPLSNLIREIGDRADVNSRIRNAIISGADDVDPRIQSVVNGIKEWLEEYKKAGAEFDVFHSSVKNYLPRIPIPDRIRARPKEFVDILTRKMYEKWKDSTNLHRGTLALPKSEGGLGWLEPKEGKMVVTDAGRAAGITENWPKRNALTPTGQAEYAAALENGLRRTATNAREKLLGHDILGLDEMGFETVVDNTGRTVATRTRMLDEDILSDPEMSDFFEGDVLQSLSTYAHTTGARVDIARELRTLAGRNISFNELMELAKVQVLKDLGSVHDARATEMTRKALDTIQAKYNSLFGVRSRAYTDSSLMEPLVDFGNSVARASFGGFFGLASLTQEVAGTLLRVDGFRQFMATVGDIIRYIPEKEREAALSDIGVLMESAHINSRYVLSLNGSELGAHGVTFIERLRAPWAAVKDVYTGKALPHPEVGRFGNVAIAVADAVAQTTLGAGGLRWMTSLARTLRGNQAKRTLEYNLPRIHKASEILQGMDLLTASADERLAMFKKASDASGLSTEYLMKLNMRGLLDADNLKILESAIKSVEGQHGRWGLNDLKPEVTNLDKWREIENSIADLIVNEVDEHVVHARPALSNTDAVTWSNRLVDSMLTYPRAFGSGIGYRSVNQMALRNSIPLIGSYLIGEALYRSLRNVMSGKNSVEEEARQWQEETANKVLTTLAGAPILGVFTHLGLDAAARATNIKNNPMQQSATVAGSSLNQVVNSISSVLDSALGEKEFNQADIAPVLHAIPGYGAWWFQAAMSGAGRHPFSQRPSYR